MISRLKVGVVFQKELYSEGFSYYKFIDGKFSYEKLEDDVLSDDDKFEIEEVFYNESSYGS